MAGKQQKERKGVKRFIILKAEVFQVKGVPLYINLRTIQSRRLLGSQDTCG